VQELVGIEEVVQYWNIRGTFIQHFHTARLLPRYIATKLPWGSAVQEPVGIERAIHSENIQETFSES
jgi:hypothetical protein